MGVSKNFSYENANAEVPQFWNEVFMQASERPVMGMYGVCFDEEMAGNEFRYMIADDLDEEQAAKKHLDVHDIKEHTWAVFPLPWSYAAAVTGSEPQDFLRMASGKYL